MEEMGHQQCVLLRSNVYTEGLPTWSSQDGVWLQIEEKSGTFVPEAFGSLLELPECHKPKVLWIARVLMPRQLP